MYLLAQVSTGMLQGEELGKSNTVVIINKDDAVGVKMGRCYRKL